MKHGIVLYACEVSENYCIAIGRRTILMKYDNHAVQNYMSEACNIYGMGYSR